MSEQPVPESLADSGLAPLWAAVRQRLDRGDGAMPGTIQMPVIEPRCEPAVAALVGRSLTSRLDVAELEAGLVRLALGQDLDAVLTRLGFPPDPAKRKRREARARARQARQALESELERWPETWVADWGVGLLRSGLLSGLDAGEVTALLGNVRRLIDSRAGLLARTASRTELAAQLFGSAHALDRNTKLAAAAERALGHVLGLSDNVVEGPRTVGGGGNRCGLGLRAGAHLGFASARCVAAGVDARLRSRRRSAHAHELAGTARAPDRGGVRHNSPSCGEPERRRERRRRVSRLSASCAPTAIRHRR